MVKRLNLGSGSDYRKGWVNVDLDRKVKADLRFDLRKRFPFKDNSFGYLLAKDVLEHFTKEEAKVFIAECWRILKPGGKLKLRIPNVKQIIEQFNDDPEVMIMFIYGITRKTRDLGTHKFGYTRNSIDSLLKVSGFKPEQIAEETTNYICTSKKVEKNVGGIRVLISGQDSGGIGGSEIFLYKLAKSLGRRKIVISFTAVEDSEFHRLFKTLRKIIYSTPVRMDIIGGWKGLIKFIFYFPFSLIWNYKILTNFKKRRGDIVLVTGISDKIILTPLAKLLGLSVVWIEYAPLKQVFERNAYIPKILYRLVKSFPQLVIVPSENTLKHIIPETRISLSKIRVIPVAIEIFSNKRVREFKKNRYKVRKELGIRHRKIVGMVSRIEPEKGQDTLIKAASILFKKRDDFTVLIIGDGAVDYIKEIVSKLSLKENIKLLGFKRDEELFRIMSTFDVAVFPTRWQMEGFGLVSLEAMMMKIPLIASNFGPVPEVVGDTAILTDPSPVVLAEAINKLLNDKAQARKLAIKGRKRVLKYFDINKITELYIQEFTDLIRISD